MGGSRAIATLGSVKYIQLSCILPIIYSPLPNNKNFVPEPNEHHYIQELEIVVDKWNKQAHKISYSKIPGTESLINFIQ